MLTEEALDYLTGHLCGHAEVTVTEDIPSQLISIPEKSRLESLEPFQKTPNRIKSSCSFNSSESFCEYVNRFKGKDSSIYIDVSAGLFRAVLDHHGEKHPSWCDHTASFAPKKSIEWEAWSGIHGTKLSQLDLAQFVERMLDTIVEPEPNVMLKAALDFQSNESLTLGSTQNLDDGSTRFNFTKDNVSKSVTFPHRVKLLIPVYENEEKEQLDARIRYRVDGNGGLAFQFSFIRDPRAIVRDALLAMAAKTKESTGGLHHYEGQFSKAR